MSSEQSELCLQPCLKWNREKRRRWSQLKPRRKLEVKPLSLLTAPPEKKSSYRKINKRFNQNIETEITDTVMKICLADNIDTPSESSDTEETPPQLVFDAENPQKLDLQGLDYKNTYRRDEQMNQAARQYQIMKREIDKQTLYREEPDRYAQQKRDRRFGLPDLYNMDINYVASTISTPSPSEPDNWNVCESSTTEEELEELKKFEDVEVWRTNKKPRNVQVRATEFDRRLKELHSRLDKIEAKEKLAEKQKEIEEEIKKETFAMDLAQADFEAIINEQELDQIHKIIPTPARENYKREQRKFPNNMKNLPKLRKKLNAERLELKQKAVIKENVLAELGKAQAPQENMIDFYPTVDSNDKDNEDSFTDVTDSDDGLSVGYKTVEHFQLRGFHDVLSHEPRGLHLNRGDKLPFHTCMTRSEWIQSIMDETQPKPSRSRLNPKITDPNHPQFDIFQKPWRPRKPVVESTVAQYIKGGYKAILKDAVTIKDPIFVPPPRIKTKKFCLTKYLYGEGEDTAVELKKAALMSKRHDPKADSPLKQAKKIRDKEQLDRRRRRHQRLDVLKIPYRKDDDCIEVSTQSDVTETSSDAWMPEKEILDTEQNFSRISLKPEKIPLKISNMRAPEFREPTLKRHPRRPRNLEDKNSTLIDLTDPRAPFNDPRISKLEPDKINLSNLKEPKNEALEKVVKYRYHHDHQMKHQEKLVRVKYVPKVEKFTPPDLGSNVEKKPELGIDFPVPLDKTRDRDWSRYVPEFEDSQGFLQDEEKTIQVTDYEGESKTGTESQHNVFSNYLHQKFSNEYVRASGGKTLSSYTYPKAEEYRQQILEEQKSVDSCLSSAASSLCTNFTDDSGSFMVFFDTKVPVDYIVKNEVPFETENENHMKTDMIRQRDEYLAPYFMVPHSGQKIDMRELCIPEDKFYTQQTRARAGLRDRLKVDVGKIDTGRVGAGKKKYEIRWG